MNDSILDTIKRLLGIVPEYTQFDGDIIVHINSVFVILNELGAGPEECFAITGNTETWNQFTQNKKAMEMVKSNVYMKVRMMFDPPQSSMVVDAMQANVSELEWRIMIECEKEMNANG